MFFFLLRGNGRKICTTGTVASCFARYVRNNSFSVLNEFLLHAEVLSSLHWSFHLRRANVLFIAETL